MSRLDDLPPDQHAALSLLLRRGKSYAEVAALLDIPERAVRDRAQAALAVLAPREARALSADRRAQIGDYLLGQRGEVERAQTGAYLESEAPARDWARTVAAELVPISGAELPDIPGDGGDASGAGDGAPARTLGAEEPGRAVRSHAGPPGGGARANLPSSRLGGAIVLAAIVAVVVLALVLFTDGHGSHRGAGGAGGAAGSASAAAASTGSTGTSSSASGSTTATEDKRIYLTPPAASSKSIGVAEVLSEGSKYAVYLAAEHLPPSKGFFYAVWLYNSPTSYEALSRAPTVGSDGRMQGGTLLPSNARSYNTMLLTRETANPPRHPGPIVLRGAFALH